MNAFELECNECSYTTLQVHNNCNSIDETAFTMKKMFPSFSCLKIAIFCPIWRKIESLRHVSSMIPSARPTVPTSGDHYFQATFVLPYFEKYFGRTDGKHVQK